ncbi:MULTISPECIES: hypothetical protein [unclassified Imperialibacter]|uniref:hypothetical protein n=1 Tax=unclassified Imperialibacter TaxID=2629706 RepID=UPI00125890D1|nr:MULTISPECIES: hypothetical protein [unclassified Imperialibacter]CAD5276850.1 conserved membrane hypothetical protein [Imperialibacter sp. 89]CAD5295209.1 conserved membrane hypothetical protein [Imperialibacter sp. 75]VVT29132.1 conserved membrane hypothetical protein [Imperialibacter sp. EC-SDR9]
MKEDELQKIWQSSPGEMVVRLKQSRLINDIELNTARLSNLSRSRRRLTQIVTLGLIPVLAMMAFTIPHVLTKIALSLYGLCMIYVAVRQARGKKPHLRAFAETYLDYLDNMRGYLQAEIKLLKQMQYWLLPIYALLIAVILATSFTSVLQLGLQILALAFALTIANILFQRFVRSEYVSKLERVEELIQAMED